MNNTAQINKLTKIGKFGIVHPFFINIPKEAIMPIEKICVVCGKKFSVPPCRALTATTCSNKCAIIVRAKSRERKVTCICPNCGKEFLVPQSCKNTRVYCSKKCKYTSKNFRSKMSAKCSGSKNPMWKGGETDHSDGYIYKHVKGHPFAHNNYVFKHRLVMEEWLKEENPDSEYLIKLGNNLYLSPDYVVHHLDSNKKNNRRRNLLVCTASIHRKIHDGCYPEPGTYWPKNAKIRLGNKE